MQREFFDPPWEQTNIVLVDAATLRKAEHRFLSCEVCNPEEAQFPFDNVLDELTGSDASVTDYVLAEPAYCPRCKGEVLERRWWNGPPAAVAPSKRAKDQNLPSKEPPEVGGIK